MKNTEEVDMMEFDPDWNDEFILEWSVDETHKNGDLAMLEELYQQEEALMFSQGIQQFTEEELSKLSEISISQVDAKWDDTFISDTSNDSSFSISSTFAQESKDNDSTLQFHDLMILENVDALVENPLIFNCETIYYNDNLDYGELEVSQVDSILTEYFDKVESPLETVDDIKLIDKYKVEPQLDDIKVCLERLPQSTIESVTKAKDGGTAVKKIKLNDHKKSVQLYCLRCKKFSVDNVKLSQPKYCQNCGDLLINVRTKKYFLSHSAMAEHEKDCKSKKVTAYMPTTIVLYSCQVCEFQTLHEESIARHLRKTKHRLNAAADDKKRTVIAGAERVQVKQVEYVKHYGKDCSTAFNRFCRKCNKIVSSTSSIDDKLCQKCDTRLFYRCLKCGTRSKIYRSIMYHLKEKCLRKKYNCCQCNYVTTSIKLIRRHINRQHPAKLFLHS